MLQLNSISWQNWPPAKRCHEMSEHWASLTREFKVWPVPPVLTAFRGVPLLGGRRVAHFASIHLLRNIINTTVTSFDGQARLVILPVSQKHLYHGLVFILKQKYDEMAELVRVESAADGSSVWHQAVHLIPLIPHATSSHHLESTSPPALTQLTQVRL